jgi:hypothetical protein
MLLTKEADFSGRLITNRYARTAIILCSIVIRNRIGRNHHAVGESFTAAKCSQTHSSKAGLRSGASSSLRAQRPNSSSTAPSSKAICRRQSISPAWSTPLLQSEVPRVSTAHDVEPVECFYVGFQGIGTHPAVQGDGETGAFLSYTTPTIYWSFRAQARSRDSQLLLRPLLLPDHERGNANCRQRALAPLSSPERRSPREVCEPAWPC